MNSVFFYFQRYFQAFILLAIKCCTLFSFFTLVACTHLSTSVTPDKQPRTYITPKRYEEHRSQQHYFETHEGRIAYTDHGNGPVLVLFHGIPTSSWLYRNIIPELQQERRVISIDFLGFGSSDKPKNKHDIYAPRARAKRVQSLLKSLDIDEYSIAMHDMGGLVAWEILRLESEKVQNLIIMNTIVNHSGFDHPKMEPGFLMHQMTNAFSGKLSSAAALELTFNNLGLGNQYKLKESECRGYVLPMQEGSNQALYAFYTGFNESFYHHLDENKLLFNNFKGRSLVLWGAKDKVLTTRQIPFLKQHLRIPDGNIYVYQEHNHFVVEEDPKEVITRIKDFL